MGTIKYHNLSLLPPKKEINPPLKLITEAYHAVGELKGRMYRDVINPNLIHKAIFEGQKEGKRKSGPGRI